MGRKHVVFVRLVYSAMASVGRKRAVFLHLVMEIKHRVELQAVLAWEKMVAAAKAAH